MATNFLQEYLTPEEIVRLEEGLPRLEEWSSQILVPFRGYRLRNVRVVWLNRRWFGERHFDLRDHSVHKRVSEWAVGTFAYISPKGEDFKNVDYSDSRELYADRYGSSSGHSVHGGMRPRNYYWEVSSQRHRANTVSRPGAPAGHSHGCMSLAEAVLEALFAEIAAAEFPCAAVPIIAIMDTGLTFSSPDPEDKYDQNVPRAIAVRPAAVRIAHAERAPLFKSSVTGFANVQATDALRTKEIIDTWMASAGRKGPSPEGVGPHFPRSAGHTVATASGPGWTPRRAQFYAYFSANGQIPRRNFHDACASSRCRERPQCSASTMRGRRSGAL